MIVGMDFGTTNSGMAVFDGRAVQMLPLDSAGRNPEVARTALYVTNDQTVSIGRDAINRYFDENVGRPVKMKKVWVGEVEVYGADMFYIADVFAWIDVLSPGRLFLSIKSGLRDPEYQGTVVGPSYYSLENLIASYLSLTKMRAERRLGREINEVVLGRPVRFSTDPKADKLAQGRLLESAFRAGYEKVYLQYEPVAAAYSYAQSAEQAQNILIFDFGGGTLDITIMNIDPAGKRQVLATGGIPIAGDIFDQKLVRAKLPSHFGEGSLYGVPGRQLPLPEWIFDVFSNWQKVFELQTLKSREFLQQVASTSTDKEGIKALISMVENNYTLQMFDIVEAAKRRLSDEMAALIQLHGPEFHVTELVTRTAFEQIIRNEIQLISRHLDETVEASGLAHDDIDAVIRTGGSSNIPAFRYMLMEKFGRAKLQKADIFNSVASGLGIIAKGIEEGAIEARAYTKADQPPHSDNGEQHRVEAVNLKLLQKRMANQEEAEYGGPQERRDELIVLQGKGRVSAIPLPDTPSKKLDGFSFCCEPSESSLTGIQMVQSGDRDHPLLLVSSMYRFQLATPGSLADLKELDLEIGDFYQLKPDEFFCALASWKLMKDADEMLIVTSKGYARSYSLELLVESIEGPTPTTFDQPLPGIPLLAAGVNPSSQLIVISDSCRAVRYPLNELPTHGLQAINRRDEDRLTGAITGDADQEIVIITENGYGKRMVFGDVPTPPKPNTRGRVIISRKRTAGIVALADDRTILAITEEAMVPFDPYQLPLDRSGSTKSFPIPELHEAGRVVGMVAINGPVSSASSG